MSANMSRLLSGLRPCPPVLMGIVNITPNSFSDTGEYFRPVEAIAQARQLLADGAAMLDLGAEASSFFRPGVEAVDAAEQLRRLSPVLEPLKLLPSPSQPLLSVDTRSAEVARASVEMGADVINDISAGTWDARMLETVAALRVPIVLMHISPGYPDTPENDEADITEVVLNDLLARTQAAMAAGVRREDILLDPGIGFGKTMNDNWRLVLEIPRIVAAGFPVVLGASRKRFLAEAEPMASGELKEIAQRLEALRTDGGHARDWATAVVSVYAARAGVQIHRVHNVALCRQAMALDLAK